MIQRAKRATLSVDSCGDNAARSEDDGGKTDVRHLFPRMSEAIGFDCLSFLHSLEVTFNLNYVAECMLPKSLPALRSSRAQKCYAHLKLEEVTDDGKDKESILGSYRLDARTSLSKF